MEYKRYIEACKLAEVIENLDIRVAGKSARWYDAKHSVLREIAQAPTADVVEVVRCGKCKFFKQSTQDECAGYCTHPAGPGGRICKSDFCSYGQRKST